MNIIICSTPFQVLLAEKIIEIYPERFYGVMIAPFKNRKYELYASRLFSKCDNGIFLLNKPDKSRIRSVYELIKLKKFLSNFPDFDKVFLANVDNSYFHFILSSLSFKSLYTFDDGVANIDKGSGFYKENRLSGIRNIILKALGNKLDYCKVKKMIQAHYTVYHKENIIENTKFIDVFQNTCAKSSQEIDIKKDAEVSILLGQPIYEQSNLSKDVINRKHILLSKNVVLNFNIDYYFPHPREDYKIESVDYINSDLIFEDYFIENFRQDTNYTIYTYFSGAVLPFSNLENVKVISIKPYDLPNERNMSYDLIKDLGIEIIEFRNS